MLNKDKSSVKKRLNLPPLPLAHAKTILELREAPKPELSQNISSTSEEDEFCKDFFEAEIPACKQEAKEINVSLLDQEASEGSEGGDSKLFSKVIVSAEEIAETFTKVGIIQPSLKRKRVGRNFSKSKQISPNA
mmetsp:Transcript_22616/g.25979  ORF Transcript_22616/g.25979 Transcript_22616/m.25979 type:complete len:134 (+) Transcript_22616:632-1033(+)